MKESDEKKARDEKYLQMTTVPVRRLVMSMALPTTVSMVVTAFYNLADAFFLGQLSTEATAAIGIGFAYMVFIQAVGFFFGHGSGNYISRALGQRRYTEAERMASVGFFTPFFIGVLAVAVALPLMSPLSRLLGATESILPYSNGYLRYIVVGTPFMMSALVLNNQLRLQGNARFAMVGLASGAVLNIFLDPLFIFGFGMGIQGASLATLISQVFAWTLLLRGTFRKSSVHISLRNFRPSWNRYREIIGGGLPSLCRQALNCLSSILLNHAAVRYALPGAEASAVAAFAVVSRVMMFAFSLVLGFEQGFQPVCGFNYGARRYSRVGAAYWFALNASTMILTVLSFSLFMFAPQIVGLFRDDPEVIRIGTHVMRWQCLSYPLVGLSTTTNMLFQNLRLTFPATLIASGRQGLFFIPTIFILPLFLGLRGVEMTQMVADIGTFLLAIPYAVAALRMLSSKADGEEPESFRLKRFLK